MIQSIPKRVTFDEFIDWYPENSGHHYELHNGVIVEMPKPTGKHSEIAGFLNVEIGLLCRSGQLPYFIPKESVVKPYGDESGYEPDIIILDKQAVKLEPRWAKESIITMGSSIPLIVEVVSTNWHDDYALKLDAYEAMGISEYWIADYLGLGGKRYIGSPKLPTFSVCQLVDGEYQISRFRGDEPIVSGVFPEFDLTVDRVFNAIN
ncbi:Uma2 family endonuclease [Limnofasciculus baicalensis]|uniref:Uma2 family endonuclease n=1 Tax=Limnofasciculus baicalensis BBK-W-15 TaxID=2699891 RepID=A0AAE3GYL9_9CYAN|nr:Uma2 family endonuclease [Limnofasciculus baicalensis]MCP2732228.1 Uma2 family endonuclease [Limnofasciculus baicalensis BBK-W-15]